MAGHFDDFRNAVVGSPHPDLIEQWEPISQSVITGNPLPDSDRSVFFDYVSGVFTRAGVRWKDIQTSGRTTVRTLLTYDNHTGIGQGQIVGPFLSGSGNQAERTGYVVWSGENFRLSKYSDGSDTAVSSATGHSTEGATTRYLEIVRDGSLIELRSWLFGDPRPSTPKITYTDGSPLPVAGYLGLSLLLYSYSNSSVTETLKLHSIAVGTNGDPAPDGPVSAGDDLAADDIQATSETGTPSIAQTHALTADSVESSGELTTPSLDSASTVDSLSAEDISSASEIGSPAIGQTHNLAANDTQAASEIGTPAIQQAHDLASINIQSLSQVSQPALTSVAGQDSLAANDVESTSSVTAPALAQSHALTPADTESASQVDAPAIAQIHAFTPVSVSSESQVSAPTLRDASQVLVTPIRNTKATVSQTRYKAAIIQTRYKAEAG